MFCAVGDFTVPVGRVLRFGGQRVIVRLEDCLGVTFHGEAAGTFVVVPVKVNADILLYLPVSGDGLFLFEIREEVFDVAFLHILNTKIIYY